MIGQFTAAYIKQGKWCIGYVEEISGVNAQGKTLAEVRENLKEALILVLEANKEIAQRAHHGQRTTEEPISIAV